MTAEEYATAVLNARDLLFANIRAALPPETEMEKRFIQTGVVAETEWVGALVNHDTDKIRIFVLLMRQLTEADLARTAGAKNFKPSITFFFELFHDHLQGKDADNSQLGFDSDAIKLQYALGSSRNLPPLGFIERYEINLGELPSKVRSLHYGRGEIVVNFREIRYE